jgi:hypothetical protein
MSLDEQRPWAVAPNEHGGLTVTCHECAGSMGGTQAGFRAARSEDAAHIAEAGFGTPERPVRCVRCRATVTRLPVAR